MSGLVRLALTTEGAPTLYVVAHDSGDGMTIYHCPFCGSGQVIARSDRTIECEFCHTSFTVQVQPQFAAFPQTIDGSPIDVPGMPGQVDDPMDPAALGEDGGGAEFVGPPGPDNQPPWLAQQASYQTKTGARLAEDQYVRHLALEVSGKHPEVLRQVRAAAR